jgi:hypothetical protein
VVGSDFGCSASAFGASGFACSACGFTVSTLGASCGFACSIGAGVSAFFVSASPFGLSSNSLLRGRPFVLGAPLFSALAFTAELFTLLAVFPDSITVVFMILILNVY